MPIPPWYTLIHPGTPWYTLVHPDTPPPIPSYTPCLLAIACPAFTAAPSQPPPPGVQIKKPAKERGAPTRTRPRNKYATHMRACGLSHTAPQLPQPRLTDGACHHYQVRSQSTISHNPSLRSVPSAKEQAQTQQRSSHAQTAITMPHPHQLSVGPNPQPSTLNPNHTSCCWLAPLRLPAPAPPPVVSR